MNRGRDAARARGRRATFASPTLLGRARLSLACFAHTAPPETAVGGPSFAPRGWEGAKRPSCLDKRRTRLQNTVHAIARLRRERRHVPSASTRSVSLGTRRVVVVAGGTRDQRPGVGGSSVCPAGSTSSMAEVTPLGSPCGGACQVAGDTLL